MRQEWDYERMYTSNEIRVIELFSGTVFLFSHCWTFQNKSHMPFFDPSDFTQDGLMSPWKWSIFLKWFGPIKGCYDRLLDVVRTGYRDQLFVSVFPRAFSFSFFFILIQ